MDYNLHLENACEPLQALTLGWGYRARAGEEARSSLGATGAVGHPVSWSGGPQDDQVGATSEQGSTEDTRPARAVRAQGSAWSLKLTFHLCLSVLGPKGFDRFPED